MWKSEKGFEAEDIGDCKYPKITIVKLRASGDIKTSEIDNLIKQVGKLEAKLKQARVHRTPSLADKTALDDTVAARKHGTPSSASCRQPAEALPSCVALPSIKVGRLYAAVVQEQKLTLSRGAKVNFFAPRGLLVLRGLSRQQSGRSTSTPRF